MPICHVIVEGKILLSIVSQRLSIYLERNELINTDFCWKVIFLLLSEAGMKGLSLKQAVENMADRAARSTECG